MHKLIKNIGFIIALSGVVLVACDDDYPKSKVEPYATELLTIKVLNAGADGSTVLQGTIDEENKTVSFPRLELTTDFSALKFEAEVSEGAELKQTVFDFSMDEEEASKRLLLRIQNHNRYKDYFVEIRRKVPLYGADFKQGVEYNFTGASLYPSFTGLLTRGASFDGEHVLIVSRTATGPHLLQVADLKEGKIEPMKLDLTGVTGGTFAYNTGALANGHVYISSLSGGQVSPLKIYYWETPESKPEVLANIDVRTILDAGDRHGDMISVNINKEGNGFIYYADNATSGKKVLRLRVTDHKTISDPTVINTGTDATAYMNVFRIEDTNEYVWSSIRASVALTDESMGVKYSMNKSNLAVESIAARIFTFNKERYLIVSTAGLGSATKAIPALHVYNITRGKTVEEALERFDMGDRHDADYTFNLGGLGNGAPAAFTGYHIVKDEKGNDVKLCLFAARTDSGFVISEFPIKKGETEDEDQ